MWFASISLWCRLLVIPVISISSVWNNSCDEFHILFINSPRSLHWIETCLTSSENPRSIILNCSWAILAVISFESWSSEAAATAEIETEASWFVIHSSNIATSSLVSGYRRGKTVHFQVLVLSSNIDSQFGIANGLDSIIFNSSGIL